MKLKHAFPPEFGAPGNAAGRPIWLLLLLTFAAALSVFAQTPPQPDRPRGAPDFDGPAPFGRNGPAPGGPGGPMREKLKLVSKFDRNGDQRLDTEERKAAREFVQRERAAGRGRRGPGGPRGPGRGDDLGPPQPGPKVSPAQVKPIPRRAAL